MQALNATKTPTGGDMMRGTALGKGGSNA